MNRHLPLRFAILIGLTALVSACSSSDNVPTPSQSNEVSSISGNMISDDDISKVEGVENESVVETTNAPVSMVQPQTTAVSFFITVPKYESNALQVKIEAGEQSISAAWVVDETWAASADIRADTTQPLAVTFYDENGNLPLGTYETELVVGSDGPLSYQITADQFNLERWDSDNDGYSNIAELLGGTDPYVGRPFNNDTLRALFPNLQTLFGQSIDSIPNPDSAYDSGRVVWNYNIVNDQLVNENYLAPESHVLAWQRYVDMTLPADRVGVDVIKFLYWPDELTDDIWVISLNPTTTPGGTSVELHFKERYAADLYSAKQTSPQEFSRLSLRLLQIHAFVLERSQTIKSFADYDIPTYSLGGSGSRFLWESWMREYYWTFWEGEVFDTWKSLYDDSNRQSVMLRRYPDLFVSYGAAAYPSADFAQSFEYFVKLDDMPIMGELDGAEKILWFWNQPKFVDIRNYARAAL